MATSSARDGTQFNNPGRTRCHRVLLVFFSGVFGQKSVFLKLVQSLSWVWRRNYGFFLESFAWLHVPSAAFLLRVRTLQAKDEEIAQVEITFAALLGSSSYSNNQRIQDVDLDLNFSHIHKIHTPCPTCPYHRKMILALFCHRWALAKGNGFCTHKGLWYLQNQGWFYPQEPVSKNEVMQLIRSQVNYMINI